MNRSYPRWLVGLALVFAEYGCAAEAASVATTTDATEPTIVPSGDPAPESEEQTDERSSAFDSMAVMIVEPRSTFSSREEVLGPQPVPWCIALVCDAVVCRCFTTLIDRSTPLGFSPESGMELDRWRFEPR